MIERPKHFIDGVWTEPSSSRGMIDVINPATEDVAGRVPRGNATDVDHAVAAAKRAFPAFAATSLDERKALLDRIIEIYKTRMEDMAAAITVEMGAPNWLSKAVQVGSGLAHFTEARRVLDTYAFESMSGPNLVVREPAGVCALITPWNWPMLQIACKGGARLGGGMHGGAEACRNRTAGRFHSGRDHGSGGCAQRRIQSGFRHRA